MSILIWLSMKVSIFSSPPLDQLIELLSSAKRRSKLHEDELEDTMAKTELLNETFLDEYVSENAVRKYTTETAGYGITYLLRHQYAQIYMKAVVSYLRTSAARPLRLLEFGCGGGMNITRLVSLLEENRVPVE